jgi:NADPH:quinone reductase-like Zn-dependent oxidoreductase
LKKVVVSESRCLRHPKLFSFEQGAAFWVAASTAYHCLVERVALKSTDTILINGASGGVG